MESLVLSPTSVKQDLIPNLTIISASPRNVTFNLSVWNYLVYTSEVICMVDPDLHAKEGHLARNYPLFVRITS